MKYLILILLFLLPVGAFAQVKGVYGKSLADSARIQFVCDSLSSEGIGKLDNSYIQDAPYYMTFGKQYEWFWAVWNNEIELSKYLFWKDGKGHGARLIKSLKIK